MSKSIRPWGSYQCLDGGIDDGYQVKKIIVKQGQRLSLQYHHKRAEHWVIIKGIALIQVGENQIKTVANQTIFIPIGVKHRVTNIGKDDVEFIEVQIGNYLDEDDIVRLDDDYGRISKL